METTGWNADEVRTRFCLAMSEMYREEVPLYGDLVRLVREVDESVMEAQGKDSKDLPARHYLERHGAIRIGSEYELRVIRDLFALFGMCPVGYYDLGIAGFPLHATAFRPISAASLEMNPFRVFVSVLRKDIQERVQDILGKRELFTPRLLELMSLARAEEEMTCQDVDDLITESLKIFRWHSRSTVSIEDYLRLKKEHMMIADIACFPSAHINHLTPRTLDIDFVQEEMIRKALPAKERIEGPPRRECAILLRQTSFKALEERVDFQSASGVPVPGAHTARFGEVEQRGAAVTPKGRALYDELLGLAQERAADGTHDLDKSLEDAFAAYPDSWAELQKRGLVYFRYTVSAGARKGILGNKRCGKIRLRDLVQEGVVEFEPITYEDFLPLSAAGIFKSNLGDGDARRMNMQDPNGSLSEFEKGLGCKVKDPFELYNLLQEESLGECAKALLLEGISVD